MGSVECIKPKNSTTFKPPSQNRRNTGGRVGYQIVSFYHPSFQWNRSCALIHCHCGYTANFVLLILGLLCLERFQNFWTWWRWARNSLKEAVWKHYNWWFYICDRRLLIAWCAWDIYVLNLDLFNFVHLLLMTFVDLGCGRLNADISVA